VRKITAKYFVYIVKCADNTFYTGCTPDLAERLALHNQGKGAKYTRGRGPVKLVWRQECGSRGQALSREAGIKRLTRRQKIRLIAEKY